MHAQAARFDETDWPQIAALYGELARRDPSPVIEINRAVAVGMADGPGAGLAILEPVLTSGVLTGYGPLHAAHADLLERAGRAEEAAAAWARAADTTPNVALREELHRRREAVGALAGGEPEDAAPHDAAPGDGAPETARKKSDAACRSWPPPARRGGEPDS